MWPLSPFAIQLFEDNLRKEMPNQPFAISSLRDSLEFYNGKKILTLHMVGKVEEHSSTAVQFISHLLFGGNGKERVLRVGYVSIDTRCIGDSMRDRIGDRSALEHRSSIDDLCSSAIRSPIRSHIEPPLLASNYPFLIISREATDSVMMQSIFQHVKRWSFSVVVLENCTDPSMYTFLTQLLDDNNPGIFSMWCTTISNYYYSCHGISNTIWLTFEAIEFQGNKLYGNQLLLVMITKGFPIQKLENEGKKVDNLADNL
jgi:hypothetical protein